MSKFNILKFPNIIAHKGVTKYLAPENTCRSVQLVHELGFKGVEFDVQMTKDKNLVVYHDKSLNTLTNSFGNIYSKNYIHLKNIELNNIFSTKHYNIPTIKDVMNIVEEKNLFANIEIKSYCYKTGYDEEMVSKLVDNIVTNYSSRLDNILFSSFSYRIISFLDNYKNKIHYAPIDFSLKTLNKCKLKPSAFVYNWSYLDKNKLQFCKQSFCPLIIYGVSDGLHANHLLNLGVSSVIMDI
ncbi:MAG: glycerophosphodiester phosphodiesterase [Satyrvirus sp.]|uniref:Glycerophosphodiester phosphodiesterase n=1 Tax=Satyrvirus sp. TaxID=2487771 RepID=A0A3G5ACM8_9VIRU|nr:MAG: glycerophosphodiester phosphodiesterase [Satyrvirus sp.]